MKGYMKELYYSFKPEQVSFLFDHHLKLVSKEPELS